MSCDYVYREKADPRTKQPARIVFVTSKCTSFSFRRVHTNVNCETKKRDHQRKELQKNGGPGEHQGGYMPHYCNFVRSKAIHDRPPAVPQGQGSQDDLDKEEDVDDGYITNTELSPTINDGARKKTKGRFPLDSNKKAKANEDEQDCGSNAILRAVSPAESTGYDPESLFERLREHGLAARDPIQIPSIDENNHDIPGKNQGNKKDVNQLINKLTNDREIKAAPQKAKKAPCVKKEKMPGKERKKKGKKKGNTDDVEEVAPALEVTQVSEEANKGAPVVENGVPQVDVTVPDLPTVKTPSKETGRSSKRKTKKLIGAPTKKSEKTDTPKTETTVEPGKGFYDFGNLDLMTSNHLEDRTLAKASVKVPSYLNDRMVLSLQSSRFELPMDMKSLEKMSPQEYLKKHCVVSTRRKTLYQKMFVKYKDKAGWMPGKYLMRCLKDVLVNTINTDQVSELSRLLDVDEDSHIDFPFFCGIAALAERILYPQFLTEDTADVTEYQKERVEVADFCSLEWKLNGVKVSSNIKQLLEAIS